MCWTNPIPGLFSLHIPPSSDNVQARLPAPFRSSRLFSSQWGGQEFFSPMQHSADFHNSVHQVLKITGGRPISTCRPGRQHRAYKHQYNAEQNQPKGLLAFVKMERGEKQMPDLCEQAQKPPCEMLLELINQKPDRPNQINNNADDYQKHVRLLNCSLLLYVWQNVPKTLLS